MPDATHQAGESFHVQFVWQLTDGDYVRAIFRADIEQLDLVMDRYIVRLGALVAGRQESSSGVRREAPERSEAAWGQVGGLIGRRVALAYEAADGRPLRLRLETLTGEHDFFAKLGKDQSAGGE